MSETNELDIAIVGMAGSFPQAETVEEFWDKLCRGGDLISRDGGFDTKDHYVHAFGAMKDIHTFDNGFFQIHASEAQALDPQERWFMQTAYSALEDCGCDPAAYKGKIGIACGAKENDYVLKRIYSSDARSVDRETAKIYAGGTLTTRASYKLNLTGPSIGVKATCASSLVSVHLACQMLLGFEADLMLAGGVNISLNPEGYVYVDGVTSKEGTGKAFSDDSGGCVPGDGVAVVALQRLEDALAEGAPVYAVIKGSAVNNDGSRKIGFTAPSAEGEIQVMQEAYQLAGIRREELVFLESHGTGTPLGDAVEIASLKKVFGESFPRRTIALGAVKNNCGHLNYASGVTGLIKAALVLNRRKIPPVIHIAKERPELLDSPFYLNRETVEIETEYPAKAAVSSFGMGGVNSHVVLEEYTETRKRVAPYREQLLAASAKSPEVLERNTENYEAYIRRFPDRLEHAAYTLQTGRKALRYRTCRLIRQNGEKAALRQPIYGETAEEARLPKIAFYFTGEDRTENGGRFMEKIPNGIGLLKELDGAEYRGAPLLKAFMDAELPPCLDSLLAQYAAARLWMKLGIRPELYAGDASAEFCRLAAEGRIGLPEAVLLTEAKEKALSAGENPEKALTEFEAVRAGILNRNPDKERLLAAGSMSRPAEELLRYWKAEGSAEQNVLKEAGRMPNTADSRWLVIEMGLSAKVRQTEGEDGQVRFLPVDKDAEDRWTRLLEQLGRLWCMGFEINWNALYEKEMVKVHMPAYAFEKKLFPAEETERREEEKTEKTGWSAEEIREKTEEVFREASGEDILPDQTIFDLDLDSLSLIIAASKLTELFGVEIDIDQLYQLESVQAITGFIQEKAAGEPDGPKTEKDAPQLAKKDPGDLFDGL